MAFVIFSVGFYLVRVEMLSTWFFFHRLRVEVLKFKDLEFGAMEWVALNRKIYEIPIVN